MTDVLLRFAHISDTHFAPEGHHHNFEAYSPEVMAVIREAGDLMGQREMVPSLIASQALVTALNELSEPVDFVLHTGDVNTDPLGPEHYHVARDVMKELAYPVYYLPGNHDHVADLQTVLLGVETAAVPYDYSFEMNGVQVVCIDSATNGVNHGGSLSDEQLDWLQAETNPDDPRPLVVAVHHPPVKFGHRLLDFFGMSNGEAIHEILKRAVPRLCGVFFGHIHMDFEVYRDGVLYSSVVSPSVELGYATGFKLVTVTTTGTRIRHVSVPLN